MTSTRPSLLLIVPTLLSPTSLSIRSNIIYPTRSQEHNLKE